jgi:hypothetical protein
MELFAGLRACGLPLGSPNRPRHRLGIWSVVAAIWGQVLRVLESSSSSSLVLFPGQRIREGSGETFAGTTGNECRTTTKNDDEDIKLAVVGLKPVETG